MRSIDYLSRNNIVSMVAILCSFGISLRSAMVASAFSIPTTSKFFTSTTSSSLPRLGTTVAGAGGRNSPFYHRSNGNNNSIRLKSSSMEEVDPGKVEGTDLMVLKYPHPALRAENSEITDEELKTGEISKIAKEMFLVMYATEGVGLAAPQVGINKRLMVYNESGDKTKWLQETTMVNPRIVGYSEAKDVENEGCLSFPGMRGDVERSKWIKVEAQNLKGKKFKKKFKGWEARIFQHEYDHLDGILYPDRLTEEGKEEVKARLDELVSEFGEGGSL